MGKKVYINNMGLVHKAGSGMVTAAFPDVCLSPPSPPAGPVPVPYPDTSKSSDLNKGTKKVKSGGKPVGTKDSFFKSSPLGNEAATRSFGASVLSHTITGKTCFAAFSMDVELEGVKAVRHLDLTTSNHASYPGGTPPFPKLSEMHMLALQRIDNQQCPCCGSADCAAAFKEGDEPLSRSEALGLDSNPRKKEDLKLMKIMKKQECSCSGEVFSKPPCDVWRTPDTDRQTAIEGQWDAGRDKYKSWYQRTHGVTLKSSSDFMATRMAMHSPASRAGMLSAMKLPRAQRAGNPLAEQYKQMKIDSDKQERINHLTPKEYGGCPTNPGNLQPQQTLCLVCQEIDDMQTASW